MDQPSLPTFDASSEHQQKPRLRPIRGFVAPAKAPDGKQVQMLGLADAKQISPKVVFTQPAMQGILPLFDGEHSLDEVVEQVGKGLTREILEPFVAQLYDAGLIEGGVFDDMWAKMKADFDSTDILPPAQTGAMADAIVEQHVQKDHQRAATDEEKDQLGGEKLREQMTAMMNQALAEAEDPSFDSLPKAIVAPYVPYSQAFQMYGSVYGRLRVVDKPARIVVLGTNHFGEDTGVCGCDKGFKTPLGTSPADTEMIDAMRAKLGDDLYAHRYDHEREHSIELQAAWLQHVFGDEDGNSPPVFAALVHDPGRQKRRVLRRQGHRPRTLRRGPEGGHRQPRRADAGRRIDRAEPRRAELRRPDPARGQQPRGRRQPDKGGRAGPVAPEDGHREQARGLGFKPSLAAEPDPLVF